MKRLLCAALLVVARFASADELADANRLLDAKDYAKALPVYQRLAEAGNAEAQLRLGEMYWFGDGTTQDLDKAAEWLRKSAAAGNADGAASLASLKRRATHGNEIRYWTTTYQGEDLVSGKFACKMPVVPERSTSNKDIGKVSAAVNDWRACYNGFVTNVNTMLPAGKAIPAEVLDMMTPAEAQQAQRHLDQVYNKIIEDARRLSNALNAQEKEWMSNTERFVATENARSEEFKEDLMRQRRVQEANGQSYLDPHVQNTISTGRR